jgi:hypothetical protein
MNNSKLFLGKRGSQYRYRKTGDGLRRFTIVRPDQVNDPDPQEWEKALYGGLTEDELN